MHSLNYCPFRLPAFNVCILIQMAKWIICLILKRLEFRVLGPPATSVVNFNPLSPDSLPHPNFCDFMWFYASPGFRVMDAGFPSTRVVYPKSSWTWLLYHTRLKHHKDQASLAGSCEASIIDVCCVSETHVQDFTSVIIPRIPDSLSLSSFFNCQAI